MPPRKPKLPNILFFGHRFAARRSHELLRLRRLTTPHLDRIAAQGTLFERYYSPHIPTTSGYANMLTGMDVFSTQVVALRHKGPMRSEIKTLPEILREVGYTTTCVGFRGNAASRGFDNYVDFDSGWKTFEQGRMPKAENLNEVTHARARSADQAEAAVAALPAPHGPALPLPAAGALTSACSTAGMSATPRTSRWMR